MLRYAFSIITNGGNHSITDQILIWVHRRNSYQCVREIIDVSNQKIIEFPISEKNIERRNIGKWLRNCLFATNQRKKSKIVLQSNTLFMPMIAKPWLF